jgi:hypothetical protein
MRAGNTLLLMLSLVSMQSQCQASLITINQHHTEIVAYDSFAFPNFDDDANDSVGIPTTVPAGPAGSRMATGRGPCGGNSRPSNFIPEFLSPISVQ